MGVSKSYLTGHHYDGSKEVVLEQIVHEYTGQILICETSVSTVSGTVTSFPSVTREISM